ncbi:hypothetical protein FLK61_23885 [Paenalkalicoccus suaedae]|uniref:Uncharacterized protein n=1 Tax=Paenalkalicoccus suaedae TaxID=2592382 RepID=A0A859FAA6_9BACI|nr:hypothetical protein [Paenalkalicoccus suaedae]QKS69830.1 hypothetical protein FLK61_23885 [Paenalkalicoccus suaedae]
MGKGLLFVALIFVVGCQNSSEESDVVSEEELVEAHALEVNEGALMMTVSDAYEEFANENGYAFDDYWPTIASELDDVAISSESGETLSVEELGEMVEAAGDDLVHILTDLDIAAFFYRHVSEEPLEEDEFGNVVMEISTIVVAEEE